jgi:hypothetical protein
MKLLQFLTALAVFGLAGIGAGYQAFSQEDGIISKTVFVAEDALGNTDTVVFIVKEGATSGIDTELGEVNLYGQEPTTDLDLRIIQRTTVNCVCAGKDYWLCPIGLEDFGGWCSFEAGRLVPPSAENIDLKIDYRFDTNFYHPFSLWGHSFILKLYAQHYPVSIYIMLEAGWLGFDHCYLEQFNEENGEYVEEFAYSEPQGIATFTFNDASENKLIRIYRVMHGYTEDTICKQPPLFPNPASGFIIIEDGRIGETFTISDTNGKTVKTVTVENYPFTLNIAELLKGTYFLRSQDNQIIQKFIKE